MTTTMECRCDSIRFCQSQTYISKICDPKYQSKAKPVSVFRVSLNVDCRTSCISEKKKYFVVTNSE